MFAPPKQLFDEITDFLASAPNVDALIAYVPSERLTERLATLLDKNKADALSVDERVELDEFLRLNHLLKIVKLKAQLRVAGDA